MKFMWSKLAFCCVFIFVSALTQAQTIIVQDKFSKKPIPQATIQELETNRGAITNDRGEAELVGFSENGILLVRHPSYRPRKVKFAKLKELGYVINLTEEVFTMDDVVVAANKWEQNKIEIPQQIVDFSREKIALAEPATAADILSSSGEVFVQKSQLGGGSPMIRGFAANSVLIVIDGVRMNNAIYRSGNLQNVITLDPNNLQGAEVVFGPGSVVYGSDALGGVMDFHTVNPTFSNTGLGIKAGGFTRYASAANAVTGNFNFEVNQTNFASYTSLTYSNFNDLRTGNRRTDKFPDFGKRFEYVETLNGVDRVVQNENVNRQVGSGYNQTNFLQKFRWKLGSFSDLSYGLHYSTSSDIPRYDRLIERRNGELRNAEWYYGPQEWQMHNIQSRFFYPTKLFDQLKITGAIQLIEESRNDRRLNSTTLRNRVEQVDVFSLNLDFEKAFGFRGELYYGIELVQNLVSSSAKTIDIVDGTEGLTSTRYPEDSEFGNKAIYVSTKNHINDKLIWNLGFRYTITGLRADFIDRGFFVLPFSEINNTNSSLNGSLGLVYLPNDKLKLNTVVSTGFRAPNVDDTGKIFDSEPGAVVVPNPDIKPETSNNWEYGITYKPNTYLELGLTNYYTFLRDALVRRPFTLNGESQIIYDGLLSDVFAEVNVGEAFIWGFSLALKAKLNKWLSFRTIYNYIEGEDTIENLPIRHVSPSFGQASLIYIADKLTSSFSINYQGGIAFEDLAPSEQNKTHLYTTDGALAWYTLNLSNSYQLNENFTINFNLENILDTHYRAYSSGISAPGFNAVIALRATF